MAPDIQVDRLRIAAWCSYDWAFSAFNTVIATFVFAIYVARSVYGDATAGSAAWAGAVAVAGIVVAVLGPVLGAVADASGRRKPFVLALAAILASASAGLWFVEPERASAPLALTSFAVASVAFELSLVFYNAMLPDMAPRRLLGRVSGWGWGLGYLGGLVAMGIVYAGLVAPQTPWFGLSRSGLQNIRATGPFVGLWVAIFTLPLMLLVREPAHPAPKAGGALRRLGATIGGLRHRRGLLLFLIASAIYRDGLTTLFAVGGLYAAGSFGMSQSEVLVFGLGMLVTSGIGAVALGSLDDRIGAKRTILLSLMAIVLLGTAILTVSDKAWFMGLAFALGLFIGPAQAAARSLLARIAEPHELAELFGLYQLTGKSTSFLGPMLFALLVEASGSQRLGMSVVVLFAAIGFALMLGVEEPANVAMPVALG